MEHLPEFISNNLFLFIAFIAVLMLTIRAEFAHQSGKAIELSPMQATRYMNNEGAVVIDVNEVADFEKGHISTAMNIPFADLSDKLTDLQKYKDKAVLTYCKDGKRSSRACKLLKQSNFSNVHVISGGLHNWLESKLPVIK